VFKVEVGQPSLRTPEARRKGVKRGVIEYLRKRRLGECGGECWLRMKASSWSLLHGV